MPFDDRGRMRQNWRGFYSIRKSITPARSMPQSKYRRKGKIRKRKQVHSFAPPPSFVPSIDYEWERHKSTQETRLLCDMYGAEPPGGWTDAQIDVVIEELDRAQRQDPLLMARLHEKHGGGWDDWTEEEIDDARRELWRENS